MLAVWLVAFLTSCEATKQSATSKEPGTRGRVNTEASSASNQSTVSRQEAARATAASGVTANSGDLNEARMTEMYSAINMSQDQISRFQNEWKTSVNAWKRNNRNQEMNNYERVEQQDKILSDILDASQFKAYQQWARENAARN